MTSWFVNAPAAVAAGILVAGALLSGGVGVGQPASPPRLLMVAHSAGYQHDVVRRDRPDRLSAAEQVVGRLAQESRAFEVRYAYTAGELQALTPASIRAFDAVLLFTTGDPPVRPETRRELLAWIRAGHGLVGVHSATDTWYDVPEYGECIGGYFDGHPWHQRVRIRVEDQRHPSTQHLGSSLELTDEIYQFRGWARSDVHVLLSLDPASADLTKGKRADDDYALAWWRRCGGGRVFYTALGHGPEVWSDERFQRHLLGGIRWALGGAGPGE